MSLQRSSFFFFIGLCRMVLLCLLFPLSGCVNEDLPESDENIQGTLRFVLSTDLASTRSADENAVHDIHLLIYDASHKLLKKTYVSASSSSVVDLVLLVRAGSGYTVYGIANTGDELLFSDMSAVNTEDKLKTFTTNALSSWDAIGNGEYLLMSGSVGNVSVSASSTDPANPSSACNLSLKRLEAKVTLNVGIASGSGVLITGYHIYGIPRKSYYVARPLNTEESATDEQTTRAEDASLPTNASDWTDSGLISLSDATSLNTSFYMYENRAGVNTAIAAQSQKVKANVPATPADSAAYVEIYGNAPGYISLLWRIYLGANNTTNFNIKRNCTYTCTVTLKPNDSDVRIESNKLIWAGSNIYWDETNQRLTFDAAPVDPVNPTEQELTNMKKQGVCFQWGSLVGISMSDTNVTYMPAYNSVVPTSSTWSLDSTPYSDILHITDVGSDYDQANTFLNDVTQNTDANYAASKGDICMYLSKTGAVSGSWRMPTAKEYNAGGLANNTSVSWTTTTTPWAKFGNFVALETAGSSDGQTIIESGGVYLVNGVSNSYPASGYRAVNGALNHIGDFCCYWSCSAYSNTDGYLVYFNENYAYPAINNKRECGLTIRCVRN